MYYWIKMREKGNRLKAESSWLKQELPKFCVLLFIILVILVTLCMSLYSIHSSRALSFSLFSFLFSCSPRSQKIVNKITIIMHRSLLILRSLVANSVSCHRQKSWFVMRFNHHAWWRGSMEAWCQGASWILAHERRLWTTFAASPLTKPRDCRDKPSLPKFQVPTSSSASLPPAWNFLNHRPSGENLDWRTD